MAGQSQMSVWEQMGYVPPRGSCNHKDSLLSPRCPCQRFMLHPIKMATSFECDGCGHHASFHNMENPGEEAIATRWKEKEKEKEKEQEALNASTGPRKRRQKAIESAPPLNGGHTFGRAGTASTTRQRGSSAVRSTRRRQLNTLSEIDPLVRVFEISDG